MKSLQTRDQYDEAYVPTPEELAGNTWSACYGDSTVMVPSLPPAPPHAATLFNTWRAHYDQYSDAEQVAFYEMIGLQYPEQHHVQHEFVEQFFATVPHLPTHVLEMGGWDGHLAQAMLAQSPWIQTWHNVEISAPAVAHSVCTDRRYHAVTPTSFRWWRTWDWSPVEIFVAAHVLEHLKWCDVQEVLRSAQHCRALYLEIPIFHYHKLHWQDSESSHILEVSWSTVKRYLESLGFRLTRLGEWSYCCTREDIHAHS